MARILEPYAIQFLSRDGIPDDLTGVYEGQPIEGKDITFSLSVQKRGLKRNVPGARESGVVLPDREPSFSQPWPTNPSIGAYQYVDPYYKIRWPTYITLKGEIEVSDREPLTRQLGHSLADQMRNILWGSFNTMDSLRAMTDQHTSAEGYRWVYVTTFSDFDRNPVPHPDGGYFATYAGAPIGPGFSHLPHYPAIDSQGVGPEVAIVWSQSISLANITDPANDRVRINSRVQEIKRHWNSYQELQDADRYVDNHDAKGVIRSAASSVDAALRVYCAEWSVEFPKKKAIPFDRRIDQILASANRPLYSQIEPEEANQLCHLYRARNSMHEGDCFYKDIDSGETIAVDHSLAQYLLHTAKTFVLWLDSQA